MNFPQVLCAAAIIGGAIMLFAGAKLIKFTVFLASFAITGWIGFTMWRNICDFFHVSEKVRTRTITTTPTRATTHNPLLFVAGACRSKQKEYSLV